MKTVPKKKVRHYGDYITEIDGKRYAVVRLPLGNGKYKKKVKLLDLLCGTKTEAKKWAWNELENHKSGAFNKTEAVFWTFDDAVRWYKREFLVAPVYENNVKIEGIKDYKKSRNKLDRMTDFFGAKRISTFSEDDLRRYARHRREKDSVIQATINRDFALLRTMFRRLQKQIGKHFDIPDFPINMKAEVERERVMSFSEETRILAVCTEKEILTKKRGEKTYQTEIKTNRVHLKAIVIAALDTAMRLGELMKLRWEDVDLSADTITVQFFNAKTGKTRKVGITPRLKIELESLKKTWDGKSTVFKIKSPHKAFDTACTRAGIDDLVFHDLRHTATTRMVRAGIPSAEVMKITGHTQVKTFMRYLNLVNETVSANAFQLAAYLDSQDVIETDSLN